MTEDKPTVYPYVPNSEPSVKREMLEEIGAQSVEELYEDIPESLRLKGKWICPRHSCRNTS